MAPAVWRHLAPSPTWRHMAPNQQMLGTAILWISLSSTLLLIRLHCSRGIFATIWILLCALRRYTKTDFASVQDGSGNELATLGSFIILAPRGASQQASRQTTSTQLRHLLFPLLRKSKQHQRIILSANFTHKFEARKLCRRCITDAEPYIVCYYYFEAHVYTCDVHQSCHFNKARGQ